MKKKTKIAAGGVVYREKERGVLILSILQRSHGGWCFPKGHQDKGEELRDTALREVGEETGLLCEIVSDLPKTSYTFTTAKGNVVEKKVHWYLMRPVGTIDPSHAHEIIEMRWVDPKQLTDLLTFEGDRALLQKAVEILDRQRAN